MLAASEGHGAPALRRNTEGSQAGEIEIVQMLDLHFQFARWWIALSIAAIHRSAFR
jgi:hypothetical protein